MAGTEAHTSHLPAHLHTARASAASQHSAAPVEHLHNFLQEVKRAVRSHSPATAAQPQSIDLGTAIPQHQQCSTCALVSSFLLNSSAICRYSPPYQLQPASSAPAEIPTHALTHRAGTGRAPHPAQTQTLCWGAALPAQAPSSISHPGHIYREKLLHSSASILSSTPNPSDDQKTTTMYFLFPSVPLVRSIFSPELHLPWLCRLCPLLSDHTASQEVACSLLTPSQAPASHHHHRRSRCCSQPGK